ncbi:MAG: exosome complex RNA-binding protein Rrp4 [Candidatus Altiarchaeota archaeon]
MFNVENKQMVIPGQILAEKQRMGFGTVLDDGKIFSTVKGQARIDGQEVRVLPMDGIYLPKVGDIVIGVVQEIFPGSWKLNINSPYPAYMRGEEKTENPLNDDLSKYFKIGDILSVKVDRVNEVFDTQVVAPRKLEEGCIVTLAPKRIPRVVGKKKSMLEVLRGKTGCMISVGQNGLIWVKGEKNQDIVLEALKKIEREAHIPGLTNRITTMIDERLGEKKNNQTQNQER